MKTSLIQYGVLGVIGAAAVLAAAPSSYGMGKVSSGKPNIIFILTDDQGYGDLGCHGNPVLQTPGLDRLHSESIRFTNFHVGPTCAPSRSGLMTGHYANSCGVWHTVGGRSLLRRGETTLADVFSENGYKTALFGKWHLGDSYPYRSHDRGFQHAVYHGGGGISQMPDYWLNDYFDDHYFVNGVPQPFKGYCTDVFFGEAIEYIEKHKDKPFLCVIALNAPHGPLNVDSKYSDLYKDKVSRIERACFYGMIANIDENITRLDARLRELGIADDTILIFMTDNGTAMKDKDIFTAGLRGTKNSAYDGGHRVPFFLRWKNGNLLAPRDINMLTANIDFMPTLMDLCGIDPEAYAHCNFDGTSLKPLLTQENPAWLDRTIVTDSQRLPNPVKWRKSAVMTDRWRLINGKELYDINTDRGQTTDIVGQHPEVVAQLRAEYDQWWEKVSVQFEEPIPISIGGAENPTQLHAHDWRHLDDPWFDDPDVPESNKYLVYDQSQVRKGLGENGYFEILVEQPGTYRFELRRWPREADLAIVAGLADSTEGWRSDVILKRFQNKYTGGKAMPFTKGGISIAGMRAEKEIAREDKSVILEVDLPQGETRLKTWFKGEGGLERGAYYVYVTRLN